MNQMKHSHFFDVPMAQPDHKNTPFSRKRLGAMLLLMALVCFGGRAWGQFPTSWHNNDHITGINNLGIGGNITITVDNGATVYIDGQIAPISEAGQTRTVTIKVSGTNGTCTLVRGSSNTGALFNVFGANNIYGSSYGAGNLIIQAGVTIDGGGYANCDPLIKIEDGGTCTLTKVTLQNNNAANGGAIYNSGTLTATTCTIQNNTVSDLGGGIFTEKSASLTSCTITGNTANNGAGGIYASESLSCTTCTLSNNSITGSSGSGGAIYYCGSDNTTNKLTINGCTINGNSAAYKGGGIIMHVNGTNYCNGEIKGATNIYGNSAKDAGGLALHDPDVACTLSAGTIYGNSASRNGGGVYISTGSTLTYSGGDIGKTGSGNENTATSNGGGIYVQGNLVMSAGNILNNSASSNGGGVYVTSTGTMTFNGGSIHDNSASSNGGGIYFNGSTFTMTGTTARSIYSNSATNGGGVYVSGTFDASNAKLEIYSNSATNGGGIYSAGTLTLGGSLVGKSGGANTASSNGGGVYIGSSGTLTMSGGNVQYNTAADGAGLYMNGSTASITTGGSINNNAASQDGGGVYVNAGTFSVSASREIIKNTATRNGGGVYVASGGTFNSNGLVGKSGNANTAERGAGVYTAGTLNIQGGNIQYNTMTGTAKLGAGVYIAGGTTTMSGGAINNNTTDVNGGGVYIDSNGSFTMSNGTIYSNTAKGSIAVGTSGGGGVYNAGTFTMEGGEIYANTASANTNSSGGGVCTTGIFNMSGGTIGKSGSLNKSRNGAGVCVGGGTFTMTDGDIIFNEASTTSNGSTTFYCGGGVYIASGTFKLQGGNVGKIVGTTNNLNKAKQGGGVYIGGGAFEFSSGEVQYNTATADGGGVYFASGTFTMAANTSIHNNTATTNGGGIYLAANGFTLVNNNSIYSNSAKNGGGVYVSAGVTFTMSGGEIYSNTASANGGGVYINATNASTYGVFNMTGGNIGKYDGSSYLENKAANGGGVYVVANGRFTMENGNILGNKATTSGGGVYVAASGSFTMDNASIHHNTATSHGGGIYTAGSVTVTDNNNNNNNKIYNNTVTGANNDGGGVFIGEKGSFIMTNGEIYSNTTVDGGGGIYVSNYNTSSLSLTNTNVYSNNAAYGGGIYKCTNALFSMTGGIVYSNTASTHGGGIFINGGTGASATTLSGVSIGKVTNGVYSPNTAKLGGGIYIAAGTVTIQKSSTKTDTKSYIIGNNTITGGSTGGGIHKEAGTLDISDTEIIGNTSTTMGGGIYSKAGGTTLVNCIISENRATTYGGGVYFNGGTLSITDSNIENNTAVTSGGGIYKGSPTITVKGVVVINNNSSGASPIKNNVNIADGTNFVEYLTIDAAGLECGSCIGITKSHSYTSSIYTEIVRGAGTAPTPANNCGYAYRNRFFFDDTDTHTVTNSTTSPYYNGGATSLYFVKNANYNTAANPWIASADATGCTIDGNGFVTAVNNAAGMAYFAQHILAGNDYSGKTVSLTANIDLSGHNWEPIGYAAECLEGNGTIFNGTFDGQGHTIANITSPFPYDNMGLFGAVGDDGVVKNTVVANINFTGTNTNTGAVAGLLNGAAYNCSAITHSGTGATAASLVGELGAGGSLMNCFVNTSATNGLADVNGGTIANCYMRGATSFVGGGTGDVDYCYAPSGSVSGTNSVYGATTLVNGKYGFAHSDQQITANSDNGYIINGAIDNRGELKGLLATLNNWVRTAANGWNAGTQSNSNGYALWTRTMASPINGDYPVLMMPGTVCVGSPNGTLLDYASDVNTLMTSYTTSGDIYLYATNPTALGGTSGTTRVYINEHVGVLQTAGTTVNARVGVTLDNSSSGYMAYDWHMFSSALTAAPMGLVYNTNDGTAYDVLSNYSSYYANGIPHSVYTQVSMMDPPKTGWNTTNIGYFPTDSPYGTWRGTADPLGSFDFYCYAEPYCHWINFKREGALAANSTTGANFFDHWREPEDANHMHLNIPYENEPTMTQGKGYLVDLSAPSMLMADGVLNNGDASGNVSVSVTATDINYTGYEYALKGVNLIGNPYQSYLSFDLFAANSNNTDIGNTYFILDADHHGYVSYTVGQSAPIAPQFLHPHQGFFVRVSSSRNLQFTSSMRATSGDSFRDDRPSYPLVNLVCTDSQGRNDFATVELDRPEAGGGEKVSGLHAGDASIWFHTDDNDWQTAFTTPGLREVPVRFKAYNDGFFTIAWTTKNADFSYMHLIDNMTGIDIDCLSASEYHFEGKTTDYTSRFRLVFEFTGVEEQGDGPSTGSGTFAFMMGDELVVNSGPSTGSGTSGSALLQLFDLNGRCLFAKELHGEQNTVILPKTAPGVYILRLTNQLGTRTQKMVINK